MWVWFGSVGWWGGTWVVGEPNSTLLCSEGQLDKDALPSTNYHPSLSTTTTGKAQAHLHGEREGCRAAAGAKRHDERLGVGAGHPEWRAPAGRRGGGRARVGSGDAVEPLRRYSMVTGVVHRCMGECCRPETTLGGKREMYGGRERPAACHSLFHCTAHPPSPPRRQLWPCFEPASAHPWALRPAACSPCHKEEQRRQQE